jgi:hypothetical protein
MYWRDGETGGIEILLRVALHMSQFGMARITPELAEEFVALHWRTKFGVREEGPLVATKNKTQSFDKNLGLFDTLIQSLMQPLM